MSDAHRCEPPPEYLHHRWHWVVCERGARPVPLVFYAPGRDCEGSWARVTGGMSVDYATLLRWRYVAPCPEPEA